MASPLYLIQALKALRIGRIKISGLALFTCVAGALQPIKLNLIGEIYAAELVLPLLALVAAGSGGGRASREPLFRMMLAAAVLTLIGFVLTDLIRNTTPAQYLRGWGRVILMTADFVCLAVLFCKDRRMLWWFALGLGVGGIFYLRFILNTPFAVWKFGYAEPVLLFSMAIAYFLPPRPGALLIGAVGLHSMYKDFRSFAGISFMLCGFLLARSGRAALYVKPRQTKSIVVAAVSAALISLIALSLTGGGGSTRREQSNAGRAAAFEVGMIAIARSPFIGYGSWTQDRELANMYLSKYLEKRGVKDPNAEAGSHFSPHSQLLQAWVEGGILGAALFLYVGYRILRSIRWVAFQRPIDPLSALIVYFYMSCAWNLLMSPFSAPHRIQIALGIAVLIMLEAEKRMLKRDLRKNTLANPATQSALRSAPV